MDDTRSQTIDVERSSLSPVGVFDFFNEIIDVDDLGPSEECGEAWEVTVDGKRAGMAVVDTFAPDYSYFRGLR